MGTYRRVELSLEFWERQVRNNAVIGLSHFPLRSHHRIPQSALGG